MKRLNNHPISENALRREFKRDLNRAKVQVEKAMTAAQKARESLDKMETRRAGLYGHEVGKVLIETNTELRVASRQLISVDCGLRQLRAEDL